MSEMYKKANKTNINLWCEGKRVHDDAPPPAKKQKTKRDLVEKEVDDILKALKDKHADLTLPKLRLWARLIHSGHHDDYDTPPNIPLITVSPNPAKGKRDCMSDALTGAAKVIASVLKPSSPQTPPPSSATGISPMKSAQLRRSCLEDLKRIKELLEDDVLSEAEFKEEHFVISQISLISKLEHWQTH